MTKSKAGGDVPVEIPDVIPVLPLRNSVLFPGSIIPIDVGRRKSVRLVEDAISKERPVIGILTQKDARTEDPNEEDMYRVGCAARILKVIKLAKDNFSVILQGISRIKIAEYNQQEPFIIARVTAVPDPTSADVELDALVMNLKDIAKRVIKLMPELPKEAGGLVVGVHDEGPGVPDEVKTAIFEPYKRGPAKTRAVGIGLGLALVSMFAELHGGRAWVEDRPEVGSSFRVWLPGKKRPSVTT